MNEIKFIAKRFAISLILLYSIVFSAFAGETVLERYNTISPDELKERLDMMSSQIELKYTSEVHSIINEYIKGYRKGSEVLLGRGNQYFPIYDNEFEKAGLPAELKYLSVVESSLQPTAVSQSGAVGLWQFISSTGKIYGLTINSTVDERKDPMRSTQAAVQFLQDLYIQFGDWTLALAAYNCGPGGVSKAQRRSQNNTDNFWKIKPYLPKETRRYVPKFVAISYVMNYSMHHGLEPLFESNEESLATLKVHDYTTFKEISRVTGLDVASIKYLNPAFLKNYIPKSTKGYFLTLPEKSMYEYVAVTDSWSDLEYRPQVSQSETYQLLLSGSMKRRAMSLEILDILPTKSIIKLEIKSNDGENRLPPAPDKSNNNEDATVTAQNFGRFTYYKMGAQQSLMDIVDLFDVNLNDLVQTNDIDLKNPPAPGTVIKIELDN